ncbi:MAG: flagellar hook-basal body complex protein, partial [Phenylobacterium sp.]
MSISSAMRAGVSGLLANSSALAALSDNIANVNTTAYKRSQVNFGSIVTSQYLSGAYSAGGVRAVNRQYVSQQGLIQAANSSTDMAISGEGFFVVTQKGADLLPSDARFFTRSGSFTVDSDGYLVNDQGYYLQGWPINSDGTIDRSPADVTRMGPINVRDLGSAVAKTNGIVVAANLNKDQEAGVDPYVVGSMKDYAEDSTIAGARRPDFVIEMSVTDSTGGKRRVEIALAKEPAPAVNTWNAEIYSVPVDDIEGGAAIRNGILVFNQDGTIDMTASTLFDTPLDIGASGSGAPV